LSTYLRWAIKDSKISLNLNFGHNSPASNQKMSDLEMLDNVLLAFPHYQLGRLNGKYLQTIEIKENNLKSNSWMLFNNTI